MKGRIDFLGCPGVGKSTLLKSLLKQRSKKNDRWLTIAEFKSNLSYEISLTQARESKKSISQLKYFVLNASRKFKKTYPYLVSNNQPIANINQYIWKEREYYANFLETALLGAKISQITPARRMIGLGWFLETFKDVILVKYFNSNSLIIFDESLSLKIYAITHSEEKSWQAITNDYFNYMPRPEILFLCVLEPEKIFERVKIRQQKSKTLNHVHEGLNNEELLAKIKIQQDISESAGKILAARGTQVIQVDMSIDAEDNANRLSKFIRNFTSPK